MRNCPQCHAKDSWPRPPFNLQQWALTIKKLGSRAKSAVREWVRRRRKKPSLSLLQVLSPQATLTCSTDKPGWVLPGPPLPRLNPSVHLHSEPSRRGGEGERGRGRGRQLRPSPSASGGSWRSGLTTRRRRTFSLSPRQVGPPPPPVRTRPGRRDSAPRGSFPSLSSQLTLPTPAPQC